MSYVCPLHLWGYKGQKRLKSNEIWSPTPVCWTLTQKHTHSVCIVLGLFKTKYVSETNKQSYTCRNLFVCEWMMAGLVCICLLQRSVCPHFLYLLYFIFWLFIFEQFTFVKHFAHLKWNFSKFLLTWHCFLSVSGFFYILMVRRVFGGFRDPSEKQ